MAKITISDKSKIFSIKKWLGLNESQDGDTGLKLGEAAIMRNWRITRDGHLQIRPGYASVVHLGDSAVAGIWVGFVAGVERLLCACGGHLWNVDVKTWEKTDLGAVADGGAAFFGFSDRVYILAGGEYYRWSGTGDLEVVEGYVPIVATATQPSGGGTLLESVNRLTGKKRQQFSPDGSATVFVLVEADIDEIVRVEGTTSSYTLDKKNGKLTFAAAPPKGTNSLTITWRKGSGDRGKIAAMRFSELFNGASDSRVFLYGDGTNTAVYSGIDDTGKATAEYFPSLNEIGFGDANTPVTAMIRHYDRMMVFKPSSAYSVQYGTMTLADNTTAAAFYASTMNKEIGCEAPGQVLLVKNNPRTLFGRGVYEWALAYGATRDERNAKRVSDRVEPTLAGFDLSKTLTFDDEGRQEYYICCGDNALVHNYGADAWYYYTNFPVTGMVLIGGEVYFGTPAGDVMHFSRDYRNDAGEDLDAYYESGAMDFDMDWRRKYNSICWASIQPESHARVVMTMKSNRKSVYLERAISSGLATFSHVDFGHFSFGTNRQPQVKRVRIKVKKFTFSTLVFKSKSRSSTATILGVDAQVRYTGNVK